MAQGAPERPAGPRRRPDSAQPVAVYNRWCKGCGICIEFCPRKVLDLSAEGKAVAARPDQCTRCRLCEVLCPDFAITVLPKKKAEPEVATGTEEEVPEGEPLARGRTT